MEERIPELPSALRRVDHLAQRRVGEETVVIDLRHGRVYGLNAAGGELLELLRGGRCTADLVAWARAAGDREGELDRFVSALLERELIAPDATDPNDPSDPIVAPPLPADRPWSGPRLLWHEDVARVTNQISPPQAITNPQCQP